MTTPSELVRRSIVEPWIQLLGGKDFHASHIEATAARAAAFADGFDFEHRHREHVRSAETHSRNLHSGSMGVGFGNAAVADSLATGVPSAP